MFFQLSNSWSQNDVMCLSRPCVSTETHCDSKPPANAEDPSHLQQQPKHTMHFLIFTIAVFIDCLPHLGSSDAYALHFIPPAAQFAKFWRPLILVHVLFKLSPCVDNFMVAYAYHRLV